MPETEESIIEDTESATAEGSVTEAEASQVEPTRADISDGSVAEEEEPAAGPAAATVEPSLAERMQLAVAARIREDSEAGCLTGIAAIEELLAEEFPEDETAISFSDMREDAQFEDIQSVLSPDGSIYLYSSTYITAEEAAELAQPEDLKPLIAARVREDSKNLARLTAIDGLGAAGSVLDEERVQAALDEMEEDDAYRDITPIVASTGAVFLYSSRYIADNYAKILVRAEASDACATIAATVREDSEIYPRPTSIEFFKNPVFNIDAVALEAEVENTLNNPEYQDIKKIMASTGVLYLYSDKHLTEPHARALVEWEEVGRHENP